MVATARPGSGRACRRFIRAELDSNHSLHGGRAIDQAWRDTAALGGGHPPRCPRKSNSADTAQKTHFRPNWMRRGSPAVVIRPAAGRPIAVFGRPNTGVLVKLKDSKRNWM